MRTRPCAEPSCSTSLSKSVSDLPINCVCTRSDIIYADNHSPPNLPVAVIVQFDHYTGPSFIDTLPKCVPIPPVTITSKSLETFHERQQLPLKLAWAITIHKSQGLTLPKAWIDIGPSEKAPGITYVAISRVRSLNSCIIEPMTFERLTSIRLMEENRFDKLAEDTKTLFTKT